MTITMSGDGTIYENGQKVGHVHVGSAVREPSEMMAAKAVVAALTEAGMLVTERPTLQVGDRVEWTNRHGVVFDGAIVATDLAQVFGNGVYTTLSADRLRIRLVSHAGGES